MRDVIRIERWGRAGENCPVFLACDIASRYECRRLNSNLDAVGLIRADNMLRTNSPTFKRARKDMIHHLPLTEISKNCEEINLRQHDKSVRIGRSSDSVKISRDYTYTVDC